MKLQQSVREFKGRFRKEPAPVVCGTDFSSGADVALEAAAALAKKLAEPLVLLHVSAAHDEWQFGDAAGDVRRRILERLASEARALERKHRIQVHPTLVRGIADESIVEYARMAHAQLVVLSALGQRTPTKWVLGSVAERAAQITKIPLLLVRDSKLFASKQKSRPALWLVAYDSTRATDSALRWVASIRRALKPRLMLVHVSEIAAAEVAELEQSIRARARKILKRSEFSVLVQPVSGDTAESIARLAETANAALVVTGTHQRSTLKRWWYGSISQQLLHSRTANVLVVPTS